MSLLPFDDRDGKIWLDGKMQEWRDAKLHVLSHGLHYGGCVFEGERVYSGKIFKLREHSERLIQSAELLDMSIPYTAEELDQYSIEVVKANGIENGYVRPVAWRGSEMMAIAAQQTTTHVAIACWEWPKYFFTSDSKNAGEQGITLKTTHWRRPDPATAPVQSKAAGLYMVGTMAKHAAEREGYTDVLMLDYKGRVAESSGSNIFFVTGNTIKTPEPETFLDGITRRTVMGIARDLGYDVQETTIMPEEISDFEEVFVTGTAAEVMAVEKIDDKSFQIGPTSTKLKEEYLKLVHA